jgi:CheY-like chemotaxis protein
MENIRSNGPGRILVIERDLAVSRFVEFVLGNWEAFDVSAETEPELALRRVKDELWDLVLVDFELPGGDEQTGTAALELMAAIRAVKPRLPVAMMTAFPVTGATGDQLHAADGHVTKPIIPSHLIGLATNLIQHSRSAHDRASD